MRRTKFFICLCVCPQRAREVARCWVVTDHRAIFGPASRDLITTRESKKIPFLFERRGFFRTAARQATRNPFAGNSRCASADRPQKAQTRWGYSKAAVTLPQIAGGPATYERQESKRGCAKPPHGKGGEGGKTLHFKRL